MRISPAGRPGLLALILAIVTLVVYFPALRGGFVFDDDSLIVHNHLVQANDGLHRFWFTTEAPDYYPLIWSLWWVEWRLWGDHATGYHVVNVLLHAGNAILVWMILQRLKAPGAWLAGLIFAIHPVNVTTVAWISEQKNTLSMLFYLTTVLLYLRFDEKTDWFSYTVSGAAFLLALLSKTAVVMLPVVLLGCVWWRQRRLRLKDLWCAAPFFLLSLVTGLITIGFQYMHFLNRHPVRTVGFAYRLAGAGWIPWFYLYKAVLPVGLCLIYPQWNIHPTEWLSYLPGAALAGCFALFWWKRATWGRAWLFGLGYFVVMLFPVLGFFDQGFYRYSLVSDHWQYYSIVGAIALIAAGLMSVEPRPGQPNGPVVEVARLVMLLWLATATWTRAGVFATAETLWRDTVAKNQNAWMAHNNLGLVLQDSGRTSEAIEHYELALRMNPDYAEAECNLGSALGQSGRITEEIEHLQRSLRLKPDFTQARNNLGIALIQSGRIPESMEQLREALQIDPDFAESHNNLGIALSQAGRIPEAIEHLEEALRLRPDYAEAHSNLGIALAREGRVPEAIQHLKQALQLKPDLVQAQRALARLQASQ